MEGEITAPAGVLTIPAVSASFGMGGEGTKVRTTTDRPSFESRPIALSQETLLKWYALVILPLKVRDVLQQSASSYMDV